jgi:hypothetical protein
MRRAVRGFEPDAHKIVSGDMPYVGLRHPGCG